LSSFLALIGQLFIIVVLQSFIEMFLSDKKHFSTILSIACYVGALYLLLQFVFSNLLPEMQTLMQFAF
jgi:hypothetical protein